MRLPHHGAASVRIVAGRMPGPCRTGSLWPTLVPLLLAGHFALGVPVGGGELHGDPELLNLVARAHQANREQIRTWRGQVAVETHLTNPRPDSPSYHLEASVVFVLDRPKRAERSNWTTLKSIDIDVGKGTETPGMLPVNNIMVKHGKYYRYSYDPKAERESKVPILRAASIQPASARPRAGTSSSSFDPMYWFSYSGGDVARIFDSYYKWAKAGADLSHVTVSRHGNLVVLESRIGEILNRYTVDLREGGNLVAYDAVTGWVKAFRCEYEYEKLAGAWVPKRVIIEATRQYGVARSHRIHKVEFIDNVVNEPIADEEFSLVKLGLRRGDEVHDIRSLDIYTVEGEEYPLPVVPDLPHGKGGVGHVQLQGSAMPSKTCACRCRWSNIVPRRSFSRLIGRCGPRRSARRVR